MQATKHKYSQPRESRAIAGVVIFIFGLAVSFFSTLVALESFSSNPFGISIFLFLGLSMLLVGIYFSLCTPEMVFDKEKGKVIFGPSCFLFKSSKEIPISRLKEVGIKEVYHAGDRGDETGTTFFVEIRTKANLEVPGTKNRNFEGAAKIAMGISSYTGIKYNKETRKPFTGSFKFN